MWKVLVSLYILGVGLGAGIAWKAGVLLVPPAVTGVPLGSALSGLLAAAAVPCAVAVAGHGVAVLFAGRRRRHRTYRTAWCAGSLGLVVLTLLNAQADMSPARQTAEALAAQFRTVCLVGAGHYGTLPAWLDATWSPLAAGEREKLPPAFAARAWMRASPAGQDMYAALADGRCLMTVDDHGMLAGVLSLRVRMWSGVTPAEETGEKASFIYRNGSAKVDIEIAVDHGMTELSARPQSPAGSR